MRLTRSGFFRLLLIASVFLAGWGLSGCYSYQEVESFRSLSPNARVRVELTDRSGEAYSARARQKDAQPEGQLLSVGSDSVYLSRELRPGDSRYSGLRPVRDTVAVAVSDITRVSEREISKARTAFLFGGLGVAVGSYIFYSFDSAGGGRSPQDGGGLQAGVIPLFSVPIP